MVIVFETELNELMHNFMFHLNSIFNFAGLQRKLSTSRAKMEYFGTSNPPIENLRQFFCKIVTLLLVREGGGVGGKGGRWGKEQQFEKKQVNLGKVR